VGGNPAHASQPDTGLGGVELKLLEAPLSRSNDPRALTYIIDHLAPGAVIRRRVLINNKSAGPQHVEVYPAAATLDKSGFRFGEGRARNELTSWISLDRDKFDLDPQEQAEATVTIQVPPTASAAERYAVIWASTASQPSASAGITQVHRVGIRVYLDVGPGGEPPSDFTISQFVPGRDISGEPWITVKITNTGQRALDITGQVTLSEGPAGLRAGPVAITQGTTVALGGDGTVQVCFPRELPNGPWKIDITLQSGVITHTASSQVTFPDAGKTGKAMIFSTVGTIPLVAGAALAAALAVLGALALLSRRSSRKALKDSR
jgi:hypothetical protein